MFHMHELVRVIQADRERELRNRLPRVPGVPSGLRHPLRPDVEMPRFRRPQPAPGPATTGSR